MTARSVSARKGWDRRRENDERVAVNLSPDELALWNETKLRFKGTPQARLEAFQHYVHEHVDATVEALERESEAKLARMIASLPDLLASDALDEEDWIEVEWCDEDVEIVGTWRPFAYRFFVTAARDPWEVTP